MTPARRIPAARAMSRGSWLAFAFQWAHARWCWDDMPLIEEQADAQGAVGRERPDRWIDTLAEHDGLEDPTQAWGVLSTPAASWRRERLQVQIEIAWAAHQRASQ